MAIRAGARDGMATGDRIFVDTSAWFAHANRRDREHAKIRRILASFEGPLVTSTYVLDEVLTLARARLGHAHAVAIGQVLLEPDVVSLERVTADDERAAWRLFQDRPDKGYSFTDCTSFTLMRRLGLDGAIALDDHFQQEGFDTLPRP